jgi:GT2 family glycosyltransferase
VVEIWLLVLQHLEKKVNKVSIITPYLFEEEISHLKQASVFLDAEFIFEEDTARIGCDLMYQKLWKKANPNDVIILHSDMDFYNGIENWFNDLLKYVNKYPEAGMFGCKLLYPLKNKNNQPLIQCAGGKFLEDGTPDHFGSGIDVFSQKTFKDVEPDLGQYDYVREVAWTTFGGIYIRRQLLDQVGDFDPSFEWTYKRDVDYCLMARDKGWKIYQVPVPLYHFESKDVKRIRTQSNADAETRNMQRLLNKWKGSELYKTLDIKIND